tara:strand:- start:182 stop:1159 length:978 start_codon:yes stop_codon:yes gene_type:complete
MILKSFETNKINKDIHHLILFYGKNEGLKNKILSILIKDRNKISNYEEREILDNKDNFIESILSKSLFDQEKNIIIKRATDKILKIVETLNSKNLEGITIILNSDILEKKSKLRSFFEKDKKCVCVPFYPDTDQTLSKLSYDFIREKKISISSANINLIVSKCSGDRETLINELEKIEYYNKNGKTITTEVLSKLINLNENHSISELVDNCLIKNKKKIISILNENIFTSEDCIMIIRSFIIKAKKILVLSTTFEANNNIDLTISSAKPPIFWKDKEITKQQIYKWKSNNIKGLIFKLNEIELLIKKNINNSVNVVTDFVLDQSS